jgi:hypothetical protein
MSPIAFPDLLEYRPTTRNSSNNMEERGSKSAGRAGRLITSLRSRSQSRTRRSKSAQRRAASAQPRERRTSAEEKIDQNEKNGRSLSRPSRTTKEDKYTTKAGRNKPAEEVVKRPSKQVSPAKRHSSASPTIKPKRTEIIDLVDRDVEDVLLNDILFSDKVNPKSLHNDKKSPNVSSNKRITNSTPKAMDTKSSGSKNTSPKTVNRFPSDKYSDDESSEDESEDEEDEKSVDANDLLAQVRARMEQQRLMEELKELRTKLESKNVEIDQLTGQLRMAISTKCDLVIAHTELERLHEMDLKQRDQYAEYMKKANLQLMEVRAEVEKEFMNELTSLAKRVQVAEQRREEDVKEKDEVIRLLEDKIKRMERNAMQGTSARPDTDKVRYYKKKLGLSDDQ